MSRTPRTSAAFCFALTLGSLSACTDATDVEPGVADSAAPSASRVAATRSFPVSGTGVHYFTTSIKHSEVEQPSGLIVHSTDIVEVRGDIEGYVLYHPTSVFDFAAQTLVNTGHQIFSGTVAGSDPVILYDDSYRFDVSLDPANPSTVGEIHLGRNRYAPDATGWFECDLTAVGTGFTAAGDGMIDYSGTCTAYGTM